MSDTKDRVGDLAPDDLDVYRGEGRLAAIKRWFADHQEEDDGQ